MVYRLLVGLFRVGDKLDALRQFIVYLPRSEPRALSSWIAEKVELARRTSETEDDGLVLELTLYALDALKKRIDAQLRDGVKTIDCSDFIPE